MNRRGIRTRSEDFGRIHYNNATDTFSAEIEKVGACLPRTPIAVSWIIIGGCNLRCIHCYGNQEELPREMLSTQQCFEICQRLADAEVMRVVISGGEPLLRDDIFDIIQHLLHSGISVVLGTNGTYITNHNISALVDCTRVEVSLDGATEITNNAIRPGRSRSGNAWLETMNAINMCLSAGINLRVLTALNRQNQVEIIQIAKRLYEEGVRDWGLSWTVSAGRARHIFNELKPDTGVILEGLNAARSMFPDMLIRYSDRVSKPMSRFYSLVLPNGQFATEDVDLGQKVMFGSLLSREIKEMWNSDNFVLEQHFQKWIGDRIVRCP
ncbi:MAG TPA: radical SAM protein [Candidatus Paceibacterota bacterium]|nr:radical SAM protein [Candidatus Paceibacterota bacterium]HMO82839.1 radical SAM protein [Candidatus Paceibacterota bacterium]